ncbi:hypothetical protein ECDEC15B_1766 [Escherichia coli DEC15B]|nr:hypothetical protein ECDEC15B_1766 [Escherichia coli DEC15B]
MRPLFLLDQSNKKHLPLMLGYSKLLSIKTPHGVLSKQFRDPGVKGK